MKHLQIILIVLILGAMSQPVCRADGMEDQILIDKLMLPMVPEKDAPPDYPDYDKDNLLEQAKLQLYAGQYRRTLVTLENVTHANPVQIALLKGETQLQLGRLEECLATLDAADVADDPGITLLRARALAARDDFRPAIAQVQNVLAHQPDSMAAHYYLGQFSEQCGDIVTAKKAFQWFTDDPQDYLQQWCGHPLTFTNAEEVTLLGRALDRGATLTGQYPSDLKLHDVILGMFVRAYDQINRDYWPAHLAAAEYFLLHDDPEQAQEELAGVLQCNRHCIPAWQLEGEIALAEFNFDGVDQCVAAIRQVDPDSPIADLLLAKNFLQQRAPKLALVPINRVLAVQPNNTAALGLLAAADALLLKDDQSAQILHRVDDLDPNNAAAYQEVAEQLAAMRQYPRAAAMYQVAVSRAPWWTAARNGLGLLYSQSGDEDNARKVLEAAHTLDPFNAATTNYLRLLDKMDKFTRKETAHFILLYDAQADPIIPEYFCDYLESIYPQVCGIFKFEPTEKTMIEVFPTHEEFAVRTTGAPWLPTVGASTGRVIAMVAPRKGEKTMGPFNWAQVLRHEFTHTVTLGETDNRIAHWFTEGLAVQQEHAPVHWEWVPMLYHAVKKHELFKLDELTWGFIRPRRPIDRQMAYAESSWICQYVEQTYGHEAVLQMLAGFKAGEDQDEIFASVLHKPTDDFFEEFEHWCQRQVSGWGYDANTTAQVTDLRKQGEMLVKGRKYPEAVQLWEQIANLRPVDIQPHEFLAGLYLTHEINQPDKAAQELDILAAVDIKNNKYTKGAARAYRKIGKLDLAMQRALVAVYIDPYDTDAHELLADIYDKIDNSEGTARERHVIEELNQWHAANEKPN